MGSYRDANGKYHHVDSYEEIPVRYEELHILALVENTHRLNLFTTKEDLCQKKNTKTQS